MYYNRQATSLPNQSMVYGVVQPEDWIGVDLALANNIGKVDLATTNGDLSTTSGVKSVVDSLMRRLATPTGGYSRWYRTSTGISKSGEGLDNTMYSELSSLKTQQLALKIVDYLQETAQQDGRITIVSVQANPVSTLQPLSFNIVYKLKGKAELSELNYTL
jgi:hypothetical protein